MSDFARTGSTVTHRSPLGDAGMKPEPKAVLLALGAVLVLAGCSGTGDGGVDRQSATEKPETSAVETAQEACAGAGELADAGKTILFDTQGDDDIDGDAIDDLVCVLVELDMPESVGARMEATRALDGMQSATWGRFEASWTYHPDDGMNLIVTERD